MSIFTTILLLYYLYVRLITGFLILEQTTKEIVTLPNGKIRGHYLKTLKGNSYLAFQEIPYASPPVGELRFKAPIPPKNWSGVLNATKNTKICFQENMSKDMENEDCLYLNVYIPVTNNPPEKNGLPVLFYIYGGRFAHGDGTFQSYGPDNFIDENVIVVTFNYRMKFFGFLSTQDNIISGNQGLKDQHFALKWVNTNIGLFGGDPSKVTIVGVSSGAASVAYHIISLFRAAILESGTAISWWAYQKQAKQVAYQLAVEFNANFTKNNSSQELIKLLQGVPAIDLKNANIPDFPDMGIRLGQAYPWAPVIEVDSEEAFATELFMEEAIKAGNINKVPIIIGINSEELLTLAENITPFKNEMVEFDKNPSLLISEDFNIHESDLLCAGKEIRRIYTNSTFADDIGAAIKVRSDARYTTSVIRHAKLQSKYTDVYFYQFSYKGKMGMKPNIHIDGANRVAHAEEVTYFWRSSLNEDLSKVPKMDVITQRRLVKLWANFVRYLNPTPTTDELFQRIIWPSASPVSFKYLDINDSLRVKTDPKQYKKWAKIIDTYGHPPFITY